MPLLFRSLRPVPRRCYVSHRGGGSPSLPLTCPRLCPLFCHCFSKALPVPRPETQGLFGIERLQAGNEPSPSPVRGPYLSPSTSVPAGVSGGDGNGCQAARGRPRGSSEPASVALWPPTQPTFASRCSMNPPIILK